MNTIQNQFCRLVHFGHRGAQINYQGLKIIDYYDHLAIVTVQGGFDSRLKSSIIDSKTRTEIKNNDDGVWISKYPKYDHRINKYIIVLRVVAQDQDIYRVSHTFCSIISNLIVVVWSDSMPLNYLTAVQQKFRSVPGQDSKKLAAVLAIPKHNPNDSSTFEECLGKQGLGFRNFQHFYPVVVTHDQLTRNQINQVLESGGEMMGALFKMKPSIQEETLMKNYGNQELAYGPVIQSFIQNIIEIYNQDGLFDIIQAEEAIQVEDQFEDYLLAIEKYNAKVKSRLNNDPIDNIPIATRDIREEIENQNFYKNSPYYAEKMTVYMDRKEEELTRLNEELHDARNLNLLENLSSEALKNVKRNKKDMTPAKVNQQLSSLVNKYNSRAVKTPNKDKLLTEFLQVFTPTLFQQSEVQEKLELENSKVEKDNERLKAEIAKLEKKYKKQGKCCTIM